MKNRIFVVLVCLLSFCTFGTANASNLEGENTENNVELSTWSSYFQDRSTHYTWYSYDAALETPPRDYNGSDICFISKNPQLSNPNHFNNSQNVHVSLHRKHSGLFAHDDYIGSVEVPRSGYWKAKWTNVGPGKYYFRLDKGSIRYDRVLITDYQVILTNDCDSFN